MSDLGDKLAQAIAKSEGDINNFVGKLQNGKEIRLMDASKEELQKFYDHAGEMLYNNDLYAPGKYVIRKKIAKTYDNCNAELLLRYILHECNIEALSTNRDILDFINLHKSQNGVKNSDYVTEIFTGIPEVFHKVTIELLLSACLDSLEALNRKMISDKFILSLGIGLTDAEKRDLTEYGDNHIMRNRMDVVRERLFLKSVRLRIDPKGLSYAEFRSLVQLEGRPKLSCIPTDTLKLLRDKVLLLLDNDLTYHINKWENIINNIKLVANYKNWELKEPNANKK